MRSGEGEGAKLHGKYPEQEEGGLRLFVRAKGLLSRKKGSSTYDPLKENGAEDRSIFPSQKTLRFIRRSEAPF